jgi:hypothetical protein
MFCMQFLSPFLAETLTIPLRKIWSHRDRNIIYNIFGKQERFLLFVGFHDDKESIYLYDYFL